MKITVLGGSGFLGSHLSDLLSKEGYKVTIFDTKISKHKKKNQKFIKGNILDRKKLIKAIKGAKFVFHFAALSDMDFARTRPMMSAKINIIGTINVLEICKLNRVKRFIFASSIYANTEEGGFYGSSKQSAENYIEKYQKTFGLNYTILRFGSLYGSRADSSNGINAIILSGLKKKKLTYSGTKKAARKYIHVKDAVEACKKVLNKKYNNKYLTITGKTLVKVRNLMHIIAKELKISKNKIYFLNKKDEVGHYDIKPTQFKPRLGDKISINEKNKFQKNIINLIKENEKIS